MQAVRSHTIDFIEKIENRNRPGIQIVQLLFYNFDMHRRIRIGNVRYEENEIGGGSFFDGSSEGLVEKCRKISYETDRVDENER